MSRLVLPSHVVVEIASYLDNPTLKSLALSHSYLTQAAETYLYRRISLPIRNPYHAVKLDFNVEQYQGGDQDLSTKWVPVKPSLSASLSELGWEEDVHQSNHLGASLRLLARTLTSPSLFKPGCERTMYPRELVFDLKKQYHHDDLDLDTMSSPAILQEIPLPHPTADQTRAMLLEIAAENRIHYDVKSSIGYTEWDLDLETRIHLSQIRQAESPIHDHDLRSAFEALPTLPGVRQVSLTLYESFQGFLPHIFRIAPHLTELCIRPHPLLVDTPLSSPPLDLDPSLWPRGLKVLNIEGMCDSLVPLVDGLIKNSSGKVSVISEGGRVMGMGKWRC